MERPRFTSQIRTIRSLIERRRFHLHLLEYDGSVSISLIQILEFKENSHMENSEIKVLIVESKSKSIGLSKTVDIKLSDVSIYPKASGVWETHNWLSRL